MRAGLGARRTEPPARTGAGRGGANMEEYFLAADRRFYESIDLRPVDVSDFEEFVRARVDGGWRIARKGVWTHCQANGHRVPRQGWKIHVSTVPEQSRGLFEVVAAFLIERRVSFKYLSDKTMLRLINGKTWSRGGSGKFFTIYPSEEVQFKSLLAELEPLTRGFVGPYILSDRRYEDSKVLHYRYGGIVPNDRLEPDGRRAPILVAPDDRKIEDVRNPSYVLPDWVEEPFPKEAPASQGALNGRYTVERALHFSNTGGVYVASDAVSGRRVVLKEARAHVHGFSDVHDAASLLRREFEILKAIEDSGVAPRPIELFQEWEHLFLAEEYLEGYLPLRRFSARGGVFLDSRPTPERVVRHLGQDIQIARKVAAIVDALHARGVVWGDISYNNVLIQPETLDVRIIDLESAHRVGERPPVRITTPGFADNRASSDAPATAADDYYGVGSILLFMITHANGLLSVKPEAGRQVLLEMIEDFGLPQELTETIEALMHDDPALRPNPVVALSGADRWLERIGPSRLGQDGNSRLTDAELIRIVRDGCRFIKANADLHRKDRLFPADPQVYLTNPLGLAHGAAGVLFALQRIEGAVDPKMVERLSREPLSIEALPAGLHHGLAGIAWALLELGEVDRARAALEISATHPLLDSSFDFYMGLAGWGMANLRFWMATGEHPFLEAARSAGTKLAGAAQRRDAGLCWPGKDGVVSYGLGHGASGIALFLLYLDQALGGGFSDMARSAFEHELSCGVEVPDGGISWKRDDGPQRIVSPYWRQGSAGIGIVALRFWKAFGDVRYREVIDKILVDCDRKYTVFPGRNDGLAGIGEFLIDAFQATGDRRFLQSAHRAAAGIKLFLVEQKEGAAFPGNGLARLSCDLATGSAGILMFIDRLVREGPAPLMLDELIDGGLR